MLTAFAAACKTGTKLGNIDVTVLIALSKAQECKINTAAIVEVELIRLIQNRLDVNGTAELVAALRNAADGARPQRSDHVIADTFFCWQLRRRIRERRYPG